MRLTAKKTNELRFSSMGRGFKFMVGGKFLSDRRGEKKRFARV